MPTLVGHRVNMREHNLFDTERDPSLLKPLGGANPRDRREADGSYNDLGCPWMGMAGARFGRNVPITDTFGEQPPDLYEPNPRQVSPNPLSPPPFVPGPPLKVLVPGRHAMVGPRRLSPGGGRPRPPPPPAPPAAGRRLPPPRHDDLAPPAGRPPLAGGSGSARDVSQHRDALVGRLADLRL